METKSFVKMLRKLIREEVRSAVREELNPVLAEQKSHKNTISHGVELHRLANTAAKNTKRQIVKNPFLNDILNETSAMPADEWATMNYRSEMAQAFTAEPAAAVSVTGIEGEPLNMNKEGAVNVVNALTRDYSSLMKAIDKKKR